MKTFHVGGLKPFGKCKSLTEALQKATHDDTIEIHKNIKESVAIKKDVIIKGNGHILTVPDEYIGLNIAESAYASVSDLTIRVPSRSIGIVTKNNTGAIFKNVKIQIGGPVRKFRPTVELLGAGKYEMIDCEMKSVYAEEQSKLIVDGGTFTSYYGPGLALSDYSDSHFLKGSASFKNCKLDHVYSMGPTSIQNCTLVSYNVFDNLTANNITLDISDEVLVNLKKESQFNLVDTATESKYCVQLRGKARISNYSVANVAEDFVGFYASQGSELNISDTNCAETKVSHLVRGQSIAFKNVKDANFWSIDGAAVSSQNAQISSNVKMTSAFDSIQEMVGLGSVKKTLRSIFNTAQQNQKMVQNNPQFDFSYHMIFAGDPGTGKTTMAKHVADAFYEMGVIPEKKFLQYSSSDLISGYVRQTANQTKAALQAGKGGVILIDEAYVLQVTDEKNKSDFAGAALAELIAFAEDNRKDTIIILAGYSDDMKEMQASNVGIARRFEWIEFEDYTGEEMARIFYSMAAAFNMQFDSSVNANVLSQMFDKLIKLNLSIPDANGKRTNGGNGGLVRNIIQRTIQARNNRLAAGQQGDVINRADVIDAFKDEAQKANMRRM